jgi:hypothetical protein
MISHIKRRILPFTALGLTICLRAATVHAEPVPAGSTEAPPADLRPESQTPAGASAEPPPAAAPPVAPAAASNEAVLRALEENKKALGEAQQRIEELSSEVEGSAAQAETEKDDSRLKLYGFMDMGVQRIWVPEGAAIAAVLNSANATSFVVGNLNLYVDAQPVPGWRGLLEVRFTNAPQGEVSNYGGIAGTFKRTTTQQYDPHAATSNAPMWGGYTVIERAHIDWTDHELFKLRVGNFFTPFGIWNTDHGTPTLISLLLPQLIAFGQFPIRQTGLMVYGSKVTGGWELGYNATLTNGRQELSNFAFDDNRGFGGRLYANREDGDFTIKVGFSGYTGRVRDKEIDVVGLSPGVQLSSHSTFEYREIAGGADLSIDAGPTRIRAEGSVRRVQYDSGKHEANQGLGAPGATQANRFATSAYVLVAHQLPFWGLEPFVMMDSIFAPIGIGDTTLIPGGGFNVRFNAAIQLKTQIGYAILFNWRQSSKDNATFDPSDNRAAVFASRLVLVY